MRIRTCIHKESCNVFLSIKFVQFNNIRQQILNWWHVFQVVYAINFELSNTLSNSNSNSFAQEY